MEVPDLDLVICLDITSSMTNEIKGLISQIDDLVQILNKLSPTGIGVVAFGDIRWDRPVEVHDITTAASSVRAFVKDLKPNKNIGRGNNPDNPEAVHLALAEAVGLSWRGQGRRRHIVVIHRPASFRSKYILSIRSHIRCQ